MLTVPQKQTAPLRLKGGRDLLFWRKHEEPNLPETPKNVDFVSTTLSAVGLAGSCAMLYLAPASVSMMPWQVREDRISDSMLHCLQLQHTQTLMLTILGECIDIR